MTRATHRAFGLAATLAVLGAVVYGFSIVGSPDERRLERIDDRRIEDLRAIVREIQARVNDPDRADALRRPLPASLAEVAEEARYQRLRLYDPVSGEAYAYAVKNETTYELCATFARVRNEDHRPFWNHPAGRHCFLIDALDAP